MKKFIALILLSMTTAVCNAADFYQTTNPFPQTSVQNLNNIYESEPAVINHEQEKTKNSWYKVKKSETKRNKDEYQEQETQKNGSFYVFPPQK